MNHAAARLFSTAKTGEALVTAIEEVAVAFIPATALAARLNRS
jgi:hypothetical protein